MGTYVMPKNTTLDIGLEEDYADNGWVVSSGVAIHDSCNEGFITNNNFVSQPGVEYKITYTVTNYESGVVYAVLGGSQGQHIGTNGTFFETVTATNSSPLMFFSDGDLEVRDVVVSQGVINGTTLAFNETNLKFTTYYSFLPDLMISFLDQLYTFRNGTLWEHDTNDDRNSFYGDIYDSVITFYVNINPSQIKNFYSMRQKSTDAWEVTEALIEPRKGKSKGQRSRISKNLFKNLQGDWFAEFLRDMNDPRFNTELDALFNGALLQGGVMKITMTLKGGEGKEVRMMSVDVEVDPQNYTY